MTPAQTILFALACLLIGLSKGGLGGPLPVSLIVPMLSLVMDPREAVPLMTPYLIVADWFALRVYWKTWRGDLVRLLLPAAVVGIVLGGLSLSTIPVVWLKLIIGVLTLVVILYKLLSDRLEQITYEHQTWHGYLAGGLSGLASTLANTGAPPFTVYVLLQRVEPVVFIGTTTLFFALVNLMKMPIYYQQGLLDVQLVVQSIWALPLLPVGVWVGRKSLDFINPQTFERIMIGLLLVVVVLLFATL